MRIGVGVLLLIVVTASGAFDAGAQSTAKPFPAPGRTQWAPVGPRAVFPPSTTLAGRDRWRNLHSDAINTDEINRAIGPVLREDWTAETGTYNVTGPVFDSQGNLYFSPLFPFEDVVLISIEPDNGVRRWAIPGTGAKPGGSAPLILSDPDNPGNEILYLALYDRVLAVGTDGSVVWDVPSGLTLGPLPVAQTALGTNYLPALDAIAGLTADGFLFLHDRLTGAALLTTPFQLPGAPSPIQPSPLPPPIWAAADALWRTLVDAPPGTFQFFVGTLLGNGREVANMFSVDPASGRLWIAATAPDGDDGTVDGVSELGALYGLDVVPGGSGWMVVEACRRNFVGGSASTPALRADGTRIYVGDNDGKLLAIDAACNDVWEVDLGAQIVGSIGVSSDNDVVYAATGQAIFQVFDEGASGAIGWSAALDVFDLAPGDSSFNLNLVSVAANGLGFQAGAGVISATGTPLPNATGVGVLDRATGAVRSFVEGGEETVAVISSAGDGGLYIGNSPVRRIFSVVLGLSSEPLLGGITRFTVERQDLLARDAACAAADRDARAQSIAASQPAGATADAQQGQDLVAQGRAALTRALSSDQVLPGVAATADAFFVDADAKHAAFLAGGPASLLGQAATDLGNVCNALGLPTARSGRKLNVIDKPGAPDRRRLTLHSNDPAIDAPPAPSAGSPLAVGSSLRLANPTTGEETTIPLPARNWTATSSGYRYRDPRRVDGPCQRVQLVIGKRLTLSCRGAGIGLTLDEPSQGSLAVSVQLGTDAPQCLLFGGDVRRDAGTLAGSSIGRFLAINAPAPAECPSP